MLEVFDTWAGCLDQHDFETFVFPCLKVTSKYLVDDLLIGIVFVIVFYI
jgi:uroporphyrinogen-III decarboxylase